MMTHSIVFGSIKKNVFLHISIECLSLHLFSALFPVFKFSRKFMELMIVAKESLLKKIIKEIVYQQPSSREKFKNSLVLIRRLTGLINNQIKIRRTIKRFYSHLNEALSSLTFSHCCFDILISWLIIRNIVGMNGTTKIVTKITKEESYTASLSMLIGISKPRARFTYWNMQVPRSCPASSQHKLKTHTQLAKKLHSQDKSMFYRNFIIEEIQ